MAAHAVSKYQPEPSMVVPETSAVQAASAVDATFEAAFALEADRFAALAADDEYVARVRAYREQKMIHAQSANDGLVSGLRTTRLVLSGAIIGTAIIGLLSHAFGVHAAAGYDLIGAAVGAGAVVFARALKLT